MVCTTYLPDFQDQINGTDSLGNISCTCYAGAMAGDYHTCGATKPTGRAVRLRTHDNVGGTTLLQVDTALNDGWNINLDTRIGSSRLSWDEFVAEINKGKGAILQGSYSAIHGTKFAGDTNFQGNHAVFVPPGWGVMDPLADGRRAGIYKYHGEVYPMAMLKEFAGLLLLDEKKNRRLGIGLAWCSLTRDNQATYKLRMPKKRFYHYIMKDGIIQKRVLNTTHTGFVAGCTPPRTYAASKANKAMYAHIKSKRLVQLLEGHRKDWFVDAVYAKEV